MNIAASANLWGDDGETSADRYLPPTQIVGPDEDGIKTIVEYKFNKDGKKQRTTTKVLVKQVRRKVSKKIAERKKLVKFGAAKEKGPAGTIDTDVTLMSHEDVLIEKPDAPKVDDSEKLIEKLQEMQIKRKLGGGLRRGPRAEDLEAMGDDKDGGSTYVPPAMRGGASSDSSRRGAAMMGGRDDSATLRVTNLSEDCREQDLRELFSHYGRVTRVYLAISKITKLPRGFAFVSFYSRQDAESALENLQGYGYDHLILHLEWAQPSNRDAGSDNSMRHASGYGKALPQMSVKAATGGK
tara:strand:+ start:344 stop:1234 length:891 start_codon:yes stop_codon:yes gene_type:complete